MTVTWTTSNTLRKVTMANMYIQLIQPHYGSISTATVMLFHRASRFAQQTFLCILGLLLICNVAGAGPTDQEGDPSQRIIELEQRVDAVVGQPQEPLLLWELANAYMANNDTIRAVYIFERLRDLPQWPNLPFRAQVLAHWAALEESRSRFGRSAELRGEIVEMARNLGVDLNSPQFQNDIILWADALARSGHARKAADALWDVLRSDISGAGRIIIYRLMEALSHAELRADELRQLASLIRAERTLNSLLYNVFSLCVEREGYDVAEEILGEIIHGHPLSLIERMDDILSMPGRDKHIRQIEEAAARRRPDDEAGMALRIALYMAINNTEQAHKIAESILTGRIDSNNKLQLSAYLADQIYDVFSAVGDDASAARLEEFMAGQNRPIVRWLQRYSQRLVADGKNEDAIKIWTDFVEAHPNVNQRWTEAGQTLHNLGLRDEAKKFLVQGYEAAPSFDGTLALADTYLEEQNFDQALGLLEQIRRQRWAEENWLASHVTEHIQDMENTTGLLKILIEKIRSTPAPEWQVFLAVDLASRSKELWPSYVESIEADTHGRLLTLTIARLLVLDRPDLIEECFSKQATDNQADNPGWSNTIRLEMARLLTESGLERKPDGERVVDALSAVIPWSATETIDYATQSKQSRNLIGLWLDGLVASGRADQAYGVAANITADAVSKQIPAWGLLEARELIERCAEIQASAADLAGASKTITDWQRYDDSPQLRWLEGLIQLWQGDPWACQETIETLIETHPDSMEANDAMELTHLLDMTSPDAARLLGQGLYLEMQRRYEDADRPYRDLAVTYRESALGDWARVKLADLAWRRGETEKAKAEWERLIPEVQINTAALEAKWNLGRWTMPEDPDARRKVWESIILGGEEGLIADLARRELNDSL